MCMVYVATTHGCENRTSDALKEELLADVSCHMDSSNMTLVQETFLTSEPFV